jgi:Orange carotenoid protein, N-terminal
MTAININDLETAVSKFKALDVDDKLATLASLYSEVSDEVAPISNQNPSGNQDAVDLVKQVQQLAPEEQIVALRNLLSTNNSEGEVALEEHPTKASIEVVQGTSHDGGTTKISNNSYIAMNADSKLSFWFQVGQNLGKSIAGAPADYKPNERVIEVLELVNSDNVENLISFFKKAL